MSTFGDRLGDHVSGLLVGSRGQAAGHYEAPKLECSEVREFSNYTVSSAYAEEFIPKCGFFQ